MSITLTKKELNHLWKHNDEGLYEYYLDEVPCDNGDIRLMDGNSEEWILGEGSGQYEYDPKIGEFVFLSDITFEKVPQRGPITLGTRELEQLSCDRGTGRYEGWNLECDTDCGNFDAEKGAMTNFSCSLYDANHNYMGSGTGHNYFTAVGGCDFYESITFEKPEPPAPKTKEILFNEDVMNATLSTNNINTKIQKIRKVFENYESN